MSENVVQPGIEPGSPKWYIYVPYISLKWYIYVVGRRWWRFYFTPTQQTKYTSSQVKLQKLSSEI